MKIEAIVTVAGLVVFLAAAFVAALIWARPGSKLHTTGLFECKRNKIIIMITVAVTVLCCIIPMGLCPTWNGEEPLHRNQYEQITESFLAGQLHFTYTPDEALAQMENPYDPDARTAADVDFHWDHAYYNGRYYMYFGVVPVFLTFLPYRVITGTPLVSYHATQLFTAAYIIGLFALFYLLAKKFFKDISLGVYLFSSVAFSVMSVWCAVSTPALYCTAVTSAMAAVVWGVYLWATAAWECQDRRGALLCAVAGSLLGALAFGCRPTIAMGSLIILALMVCYLKDRSWKGKWLDALAFLAPYVLVGALLMAYNYVRFGSILEFGQSYQLTCTDVRNMPTLLNLPTIGQKLDLLKTYIANALRYLIRVTGVKALTDNGTFITFPILLYIFWGLFNKKSRALIKTEGSWLFVGLMLLTPVVILALDVLGSPDLFPRYRMDTLWVLGILAYVFLGIGYQTSGNRKAFGSAVCYVAILTTAVSLLLIAFPDDLNFTAYYIDEIRAFLASLI